MTATKTVMTGVTLATLLLFGGGVFVLLNLGSLAKPIIEKIATDTLGVKVSLSGLDISIEEKTASISGLTIANPAGYSKPNAITNKNITITMGEIGRELIVFNNITVADTDVFLEVGKNGTNLNDLKNGINVPAEEAPAKSAPASSEGDAQAENKPPLKVIVKKFTLSDAALNPAVTLIEGLDLNPVVVPDITLRGIGEKENGILAQEAVAQVMEQLLKEFNSASSNAGFLKGLSKDALKDLGQEQIDSVKDQVKDKIEGLGAKIPGLFGN